MGKVENPINTVPLSRKIRKNKKKTVLQTYLKSALIKPPLVESGAFAHCQISEFSVSVFCFI